MDTEKKVQYVGQNFETLVIGPGGIKGITILGSIKALQNNNLLNNIKNYVGVSVGSIISLLLICNYSVSEILYESIHIPNFFCDINFYNLKKMFMDLVLQGGIINNDFLKKKLETMVIKKFGSVLTLKELYEITNLNFVSVTLNLSKDTTEYLSHTFCPDLSCVDAVMMSINIPIIFQKLKINGSLYIDGAFGDSYPINLYPNSIGISIETTFDDIDDSNFSYILKVMSCSVTQLTKRSLQSGKYNIRLKCDVKDPLSKLSCDKKLEMYSIGYNSTLEILHSLN